MLGICSMLPRARLIFVLRDPVMRAYSNWRFSRMHGLENLGFAAALDAENHRFRRGKIDTVSVDPFAYVARGHYERHLERWARHFERDRFIIMTSEDIFANPEHIREVFSKLGVRDIRLRNTGPVNASHGDHPPMSRVVRERLRAEFAESNAKLHAHWGVDVSHWS